MVAEARSKRGTVKIENLEGMLRLRWSHVGKCYCLALGMPDTRVNRLVAESKAKTIEGDLVTGNFDPTRRKYKTQQQQQSVDITIAELLQRFTKYKSKQIQGRSLDKFKASKKPLAEFFKGKPVSRVDEQMADDFRLYLAKTLASATQKERLITLNACWN